MNSEVSSRVKYLNKIRRSFSRELLDQQVGWAGPSELHRIDCEEYLVLPRAKRCLGGPLRQVLAALGDDFEAGLCEFPALHHCVRDPLPLIPKRAAPEQGQALPIVSVNLLPQQRTGAEDSVS